MLLAWFSRVGLYPLVLMFSLFGIMGSGLRAADDVLPTVTISPINAPAAGGVEISGTSFDDMAIDRNRLLVQNLITGQYWSGSEWISSWSWFAPDGINEWSYSLNLPAGQFETIAWTWDSSNNIGNLSRQLFSVAITTDTTDPSVTIDSIGSPAPGPILISGVSSDDVGIDRNRLLVRNQGTGEYWNGTEWIDSWSWFEPNGTGLWDYELTLTGGSFSTTAWTWDTSNNLSAVFTTNFFVGLGADTTAPVVSIDPVEVLEAGAILISGTSIDDSGIDRNRLLVQNLVTGQYWNGVDWTDGWSWFEPSGTSVWDYELLVPSGNFITTAWTWDTSNNISSVNTQNFFVGVADTIPPVVSIDPVGLVEPGLLTITGMSSDDVAIDRNKLLIRDLGTGQYWNGEEWIDNWVWFTQSGTNNWSHTLTLSAGTYTATAWTWDTSNTLGLVKHETFQVSPAQSVDVAPIAVNDSEDENGQPLMVAIGSSVTIDVLSNDSDDGELDVSSVLPSIPEAVVNTADGSITYSPTEGTDTGNPVTFTYTVKDDAGLISNVATVTVVVTPAPNLAPLAVNDVDEVTSIVAIDIDVVANDTDADGSIDPSTVAINNAANPDLKRPDHGHTEVNPTTGFITYFPATGVAPGTIDSFEYTVKDSEGLESEPATVLSLIHI